MKRRHQLRGSRIDLINIKVYEERCIKIQEKKSVQNKSQTALQDPEQQQAER